MTQTNDAPAQMELDGCWARRATRPRLCVTVFADASFDPRTGAAGWGAIVMRSAGYFEFGGALRDPCESATDAELRAAANGLRKASAQGLLMGKPYIVLQLDSTDAIACILRAVPRARYSAGGGARDVADAPSRSEVPGEFRCAINHIADVIESAGADLILRHVKGHRRGESGRHRLNDRADTLAKQGMRRVRDARFADD